MCGPRSCRNALNILAVKQPLKLRNSAKRLVVGSTSSSSPFLLYSHLSIPGEGIRSAAPEETTLQQG
jgi:hypothetical protein